MSNHIDTENNENKYIKCSRCHMKFINDDEHIKTDFGYNRLNVRYKQCVRCRTSRREYDQTRYELNKDRKKEYAQTNRDKIRESQKKYNQQRLNAVVDDDQQVCKRCLKTLPKTDYGTYKKIDCKLNEIELPHKSCAACRTKMRMAKGCPF